MPWAASSVSHWSASAAAVMAMVASSMGEASRNSSRCGPGERCASTHLAARYGLLIRTEVSGRTGSE